MDRRHLIAALLAFPLCAGTPLAQEYPTRPVRLIVPFPAGGSSDVVARTIAQGLSANLGWQFIVENRAGAAGNVGTDAVAKATADGYTLALSTSGPLANNKFLYKSMPYDPEKAFTPVVLVGEIPLVIVANLAVPAKNLKEFIDLARSQPGKLTFASTSSGPQMAGELFRLTTKTQMLHVPYKGGGPATADLLAGHVSIMFGNPTAVVPHIKAGKLRALGVMDSKRNPAIPDVPTALEAGYPELSNVIEWYGVVVPAATPRERVALLSAAVLQAMHSPDISARIQALGQTLSPLGAEDFGAFMRAEYDRWGQVVKASGAKAD